MKMLQIVRALLRLEYLNQCNLIFLFVCIVMREYLVVETYVL